MTIQSYLNFDLLLSENAGSYQAIVTSYPTGNSKPVRDFALPFSNPELEFFIKDTTRSLDHRRSLAIPDLAQPALPDIREIGKKLYRSIFDDEVERIFLNSREYAESQGKGLRINLYFAGASSLIGIPWEWLRDETTVHQEVFP